jgi:hypothetical protein
MNVLRFLILLIGIAFFGCKGLNCGDVDEWINDAPAIFEEYKEVKKEILSNQAFMDKYTHQGSLFVQSKDTNYSMPKFEEWLEKGNGFISISDSSESLEYRYCYAWDKTSYAAFIYKGKQVGQYHSMVEIIDSLYLGDGYYAHVIHDKDTDSF